MSSNKPSVTLLPKPEEPTVDAFIGEVRERRATGGLSRPVGGGNIRPFGFPQVDRNKNYGMHTLHPSTPSTQVDGAPSVRNANSDKKQRSVAFVDPNEKSANHQHIPAATTSSAGSSSYAQSNQNSNSPAIILATMHYNSFLGDKTYTLSDALLLAVTGATIHNGDSSSSSSSLSPAAAFCPERVNGEDFVHLLEKALSSAIAHHRLSAMDVICRELMSCEASDGANDTFRHYFLFGPHCGRRVHRLVLCLSQAAPREVVRVLEVLCKLVGELLSSAQQHAETLSDFAVPLGDASVDSAPPLAESEQPTFEPFPSEDQLRQFSEDLRLDLGKGLYLLGLHLVLPRVAIPPSEWGVAAGVAAPEARRVFWSLLAMCASYPPTLVAWFGSNGQESHRGGAFLAMVKREISATMQPFVLGHESYLSPPCDKTPHDDNANQNAPSFAFQSFGNEVLRTLLQFLRRACHVRQGCFAFVETVRPLLMLLLEHFQQDIGCDASRLAFSNMLTPDEGNNAKKSSEETLVSVKSNHHAQDGLMVYIGSFLLLRSFIRHGCDSILSDCVSHLVALVPLGSLGVAELALLSSAGAESDDQNMLSPSIASNLAQEAYRLIVRSCEKTSTKDDRDGSNNLLNLVAQSTAFQYLATYVGMEGLRAFAPWLAPTIPEAQQAIKTLLGTKLMTSVELEQMFLTPQQQQRKVVSTEGGSTLSAVKMSLQLGRSYNFARFLTSIPRVFPATRTVVHGYCDTIVTRFMDLMFSKRSILFASSSSSAAGGNDFASQCKSVGGIVLSSPLSMEELSTVLEVVTALSTTATELDDDNGSEAPRAVVGGLKRNAKAVAIILLDIIAKTMQCLDSAPLLAALLFPNDLHSADAVVSAVCARAADSAGTAIDPATTSGGWISKLFWLHIPAATEVLTTALTCHPQARHVFHWELLFSDVVLWSCSHKASNKDEEQLRCDAMLVLAQIAFTQGQLINDQSVNQSIASTIGPYFTSTFAVVPRLPPSVVCALCCGAVLLQPEGSIACLRILHESHDDFSETSAFFLEHQKNNAKSSSVGKSSVLSFLDMLFHQSLSMGGSLEEHQSRGGAMNAQPSSSNDGNSDQQGGEEISGWSSLQRIVECLQLLVPLFRFTEHSSWPHLVCGYMIRRVAVSSNGAAGKSAVVAMQSDFMAMCIQDTLQTLHWEGFEAEDRKAAARSEGTHEFHATEQENRSSTGGGDSWDDDEFAF